MRDFPDIDELKKAQLGQYFTSARTAHFMASLFTPRNGGECRLLDPGAGIGSLSSAFLERCISSNFKFTNLEVTAFEIDSLCHEELRKSLSCFVNKIPIVFEIIDGDFIENAVNILQFSNNKKFTHTILNPPYRKINSGSIHRRLLRQVGVETVNLYTAFVALAVLLLENSGEMVTIIPRSFCNGPYYRPFREFILARTAIRHIHLFESRTKTFKEDGVLQENVIIKLVRGEKQEAVVISTSMDDSFSDLKTHAYPFERIVIPNDAEKFIHIPTSPEFNTIELSASTIYSLEDIGVSVSTGPVVEFRLKNYLSGIPGKDTVPLLYPLHFIGQKTIWPNLNNKKPNAIRLNDETIKWFYPKGFYCVVRRFSSKEERRRIIAGVVEPSIFFDTEFLGFENHLNVLHENKHGMSEELARGLAFYLNTTAIDKHFRRFSGHTQVNAIDLKQMKYPSRDRLISLGRKAKLISHDQYDQVTIDRLFQEDEEQ